MSESDKKQTQTASSGSTDAGAEQVRHALEEAQDKGFIGATPDETPNEDYTVAGVTKKARKDGGK